MGRGRVELKKIENKINRQVTFAKRRNGLLKKAYELSVLCDAEVALIIFSGRGKLYEFCSSNNMLKTLERYQKCNYGAPEPIMPSKEIQSSQQEYLKLKARHEELMRTQKHFLGEDLGPLNSKQLEQLERQLESSVRQIRSTRIQQMLDQLSELQRKEQVLVETNRDLRRKYEETQQANHQRVWEANAHAQAAAGYGQQPPQQQGNGFFHPLECQPTLQMGYHSEQITLAAPGATVNNFMPGWMP
ncbi:hypothetical protein QJS04_geneDACA015450 [Acorus gramineus]|uniref:Uncharacterized protein n=1 Tax=Acorus gramineus TaxID=55184 RepID=A0AAV9A4A0_ACOGR|nr:hypothetical protein QJS04_geneDACA015450 [Acorus gramineus]